jgi:choline dehydrogenase-like flavoprotein
MQRAGLHPYKGHMALKDATGGAAYLGRKCPTDQKMDGRSAGVEPALATGRAALIDRCEALEILHENGAATGVRVRKSGTETQLTARATVLAAGALHAPRLLMASGDLGAQSGMVGRNLMFHLNEMFLLWPKRAARGAGASKALAFRDLYHHKGQRFGMVQAMGVEARYGEVLHYLNRITARSWLRHLPGRRPMLRLLAALAQRLFGSAKMFVGILEDLPKAENRVIYDPQAPQRLAIEYTMAPELLMRRRAFRKAIRRGLRGLQMMFVGVTPELNYGHPCGTLRFGDDPQNAVLDRNCAVYGTRQLWGADASFMPTSMGVNPSLTIAANALRVGDVILATLAPKERTDG